MIFEMSGARAPWGYVYKSMSRKAYALGYRVISLTTKSNMRHNCQSTSHTPVFFCFVLLLFKPECGLSSLQHVLSFIQLSTHDAPYLDTSRNGRPKTVHAPRRSPADWQSLLSSFIHLSNKTFYLFHWSFPGMARLDAAFDDDDDDDDVGLVPAPTGQGNDGSSTASSRALSCSFASRARFLA